MTVLNDNEVFGYLKKYIPVFGFVIFIVSTVVSSFIWAEKRFEDMSQTVFETKEEIVSEMQSTRLAIISRIEDLELRRLMSEDKSEETIIEYILDSARDTGVKVSLVIQNLIDINFKLGEYHGAKSEKLNYVELDP